MRWMRSLLVTVACTIIMGCSGEMIPFHAALDPNPVNSSDTSYHLKVLQYNACIARKGAAFCWGDNTYGQIGDGTTNNALIPTAVAGLSSGVTFISPGAVVTTAIVNGAAYAWGAGGYVGDGTNSAQHSPVAVLGMSSGVTLTSSGGYSSCAIQSGALLCWGDNSGGQLGNGSTSPSNAPTAVTGLSTGVTSVSVDAGAQFGKSFACAIQNDAAFCWGDNSTGQLGNNSTVPSTTKVAVSGMVTGVTQIAAGTDHSCAIQFGSLYCWGKNSAGQLGNNSTVDSSVPVAVTGLPSGEITQLAIGNDSTCVLVNKAVWCWGGNAYGIFGNGLTGGASNSSVPVQATAVNSNVTEIGTGYTSGSAIDNGMGISWGTDSSGSIGNNVSGAGPYLSPVNILSFPN